MKNQTNYTPWKLQTNGGVADILEGHQWVAGGVEINRAARIVRAVNAHEELLAACKLALERWGKAPGTAEVGEPVKVGDMLLKAIAKAEARS